MSVDGLDVIDTLDVEYAGDAFDAGDDVFELFAVADVECHFDSCARIVVASALKRADVRSGIANHAGDRCQHAGTVLGENTQANGKLGLR